MFEVVSITFVTHQVRIYPGANSQVARAVVKSPICGVATALEMRCATPELTMEAFRQALKLLWGWWRNR